MYYMPHKECDTQVPRVRSPEGAKSQQQTKDNKLHINCNVQKFRAIFNVSESWILM